MSVLYHHTDTARLPWILRSGELQPGANKIGGFPDPDFLWATSDPRGDFTSAQDRGKHFRDGFVRHVRFSLRSEHFIPWADVPGQFGRWTASQVSRLDDLARGKSDPANWWCCPRPIGMTEWLAVETKSYRDNRWVPFDPTTEVLPFRADVDQALWLGVGFGSTLFLSRQVTGPHGADGYQVKTIDAKAAA